MRALTNEERQAIMMLAGKLESDEQRAQLLIDLENSVVKETVPDGSILSFDIGGYQRPPSHGRGQYRAKDGSKVEGVVTDSDGAGLEVLLLADINRRIYELELVKYLPGPVIKPDWSTFRVK